MRVVAGLATFALEIVGTGDRIDFGTAASAAMGIRTVSFADGTSWNAATLLAMAQAPGEPVATGRHWRLPACFDPGFALDLPTWALAKQMPQSQLIERLLATRFRVYMIGFLPGFPYMGGLPPELAMPRLSSPRQRVPANSIAIAGEMCAVYPWESPGGWNLIGKTPVPLFDLRQVEQPAMLAAGDLVSWYAIDKAEYEHLFAQCSQGERPRETFLAPGDAP